MSIQQPLKIPPSICHTKAAQNLQTPNGKHLLKLLINQHFYDIAQYKDAINKTVELLDDHAKFILQPIIKAAGDQCKFACKNKLKEKFEWLQHRRSSNVQMPSPEQEEINASRRVKKIGDINVPDEAIKTRGVCRSPRALVP